MPEPTRRHLKDLAALHRKRHRDRLGLCLVEGVRSVASAVAAGAPLVEVLATAEALADGRVAALLGQTSVPVHTVPAADLARIADTATTQGVLAVARVEHAAPADIAGPVLALDGVQDPGNVGAMLRSAAWFGVRGALIGPGTADPFGPKAVRAAMGGLWDLRLAPSDDLAADLRRLQARGLPLFGADLDGEPAHAWAPPPEAVLVLGSEAHGLSDEVTALLDSLPRSGGGRVRIGAPNAAGGARGVESLNVAVATGILLHRWLGG